MKLFSKKWLKKRNRSLLSCQHRPSLPYLAPSRVDVSAFDDGVPYSIWSDMVAVMRPLIRDYQNGHFNSTPKGLCVTTDLLPSGVSE